MIGSVPSSQIDCSPFALQVVQVVPVVVQVDDPEKPNEINAGPSGPSGPSGFRFALDGMPCGEWRRAAWAGGSAGARQPSETHLDHLDHLDHATFSMGYEASCLDRRLDHLDHTRWAASDHRFFLRGGTRGDSDPRKNALDKIFRFEGPKGKQL